MSDLAKQKKIRGGHRGYLTTIVGHAQQLVTEFSEENWVDAAQLRDSITETLETVRKLDGEIIELLAGDEHSSEEDIQKEVEDTGKIRADGKRAIKRLEEKLATCSQVSTSSSNTTGTSAETSTNEGSVATNSTAKIRAKLPKLEVKRFKGNVCKWQEFWDSFESSIHQNDCLSDVDKFNYLRGLLEEPAKSCIAGFSLTASNYESAVNILKER